MNGSFNNIRFYQKNHVFAKILACKQLYFDLIFFVKIEGLLSFCRKIEEIQKSNIIKSYFINKKEKVI